MSDDRKRKRLGQHFLVDANVIDEILALIRHQPGDAIVEIGPGFGALTQALVSCGANVHAIEVDKHLANHLKQSIDPKQVTLHLADALRFDFASVAPDQEKIRVVGNLPYSISTPLMLHLAKFANYIENMCLMVQYEVAQRLVAKCGSSNYGRLTVSVGRVFRTESVFNVEPESFDPQPKVRSSVIFMQPRPSQEISKSGERVFSDLVRLAFGNRRKTIRNSLGSMIDDTMFNKADINASLRAQDLSIENYIALVQCVISNQAQSRSLSA